MLDLQMNVFLAQETEQLTGFFISDGVKGMMEGEVYSAIEKEIPITETTIDYKTGYSDETMLTTVHKIYLDFANYLVSNCAV